MKQIILSRIASNTIVAILAMSFLCQFAYADRPDIQWMRSDIRYGNIGDGRASTDEKNEQAQSSISSILNPDGTIKEGSTGSFDPKGFRMAYGPNGEPRFLPEGDSGNLAPEDECTDGWDNRFGLAGANNNVYAVAVDAAGNLYAAGAFTAIGNVTANRIAKWNGSSWTALGTGMNSSVAAIAVSGTDVYAGGGFTTAGGVGANYIAKWNGSSWSALGSGMNGIV
ncbi:MAG: hypothetical protein IT172_00005, partial [Acidobacteria bacterium]|nr:hypothetical protein [Acidobacteriota bacterium]